MSKSGEYDKLDLSELITMQSDLVAAMNRRFQKSLGLAFSDVVGSTSYFARFGDVAGRSLQQRHIELINEVLPAADGRIVDTAGDGAFICFPKVDAGVTALIKLGNAIVRQNRKFPAEHRLTTRVGIHFGPVLTDGTLVSGDSVNLCSRIAGTGAPGEMRLSREAYLELSPDNRVRCRSLPATQVKGFEQPIQLNLLNWKEGTALPTHVYIRETKQRVPLPDQDTITFGRLDEESEDGTRANDFVLRHPDDSLTDTISRWHFELRRRDDELICRSVSDGKTVVDGVEVPKGIEVTVRNGSVIIVAGILTLMLRSEGDEGLKARMKATTVR